MMLEICPPPSTHFWHLLRKYTFTRINSICEMQSISRLILASNSFKVWRFAIFIYGDTWKIKCMQLTPTYWITKSKYQAWNWLYFGILINPCTCIFPKRMLEMCGWRRTTFPTSHVIRNVIIFFVILLNCRQLCSGGIILDLPAGTWAISGCHRQPSCRRRHFSKRHCIFHVFIHLFQILLH